MSAAILCIKPISMHSKMHDLLVNNALLVLMV